jgi:predicted RNase H-like HicB family nuclease
MSDLEYSVMIGPLSPEDGGGFLARVPELPGCMSDGETPEEAVRNIRDAIEEWKDEARRLHRPIPAPSGELRRA